MVESEVDLLGGQEGGRCSLVLCQTAHRGDTKLIKRFRTKKKGEGGR